MYSVLGIIIASLVVELIINYKLINSTTSEAIIIPNTEYNRRVSNNVEHSFKFDVVDQATGSVKEILLGEWLQKKRNVKQYHRFYVLSTKEIVLESCDLEYTQQRQ